MAFDFPASPSTGQIFQPSGGPAWQYDGTAWRTLVTSQGVRSPTRTVFTANGNYTPPAGCTSIDVEVIGGGGAGGGAPASGASQFSVGGGGGAGGWGRKLFNVNALTFPVAVTVGAGGTGVSGAAGNTGGASSFSTLSAGGGGGAPASTVGATVVAAGGIGGLVSGGDLASTGGSGLFGYAIFAASYIAGGTGANSSFGRGGGPPVGGPAGGIAGAGYGAGGSGATTVASAAQAGGNGAPGAVIITEYYTGDSPSVRTTAETRNRIVNGAMQISQENGTAIGTTAAYYVADQWYTLISGIVFSASKGAAPTHQIGILVTTGKALAAGDYLGFTQPIEGINLWDFGYGAAGAVQSVLRFEVFATVAGTYGVSFRNGTANRSLVLPFTVTTPNAWQTFTLVIPGDTAGTWAVDTAAGMQISFVFAAGTTFTTAPGSWQAGNFIAPTGITNGAATTNNSFYVRNVGLYLDPGNTGIAPPWQMPDEAQELAKCQRYWQVVRADLVGTAAAAGNLFGAQYPFPVVMRTSPSVSPNADGTPTNVSTVSFDSMSFMNLRIYMQSTAAGTYGIAGRSCKVSARM